MATVEVGYGGIERTGMKATGEVGHENDKQRQDMMATVEVRRIRR